MICFFIGFLVGLAIGSVLSSIGKPKPPQCVETVKVQLIDSWGTVGHTIRVQCGLVADHGGLCCANGQGLYDSLRWLPEEDAENVLVQNDV